MADIIRRENAQRILSDKGVKQEIYSPPLWELIWAFGYDVPPPYFASFRQNFLIGGIFFGFCWGLLFSFLRWINNATVDAEIMFFISAIAAVIVGLISAINCGRKKRNLGLPTWESLSSTITETSANQSGFKE